jgi:hypothetical protein
MELELILGIVLTAIGILVGLYLPILASHFATPEKIRLYPMIGALLVVIGTLCESLPLGPSRSKSSSQPVNRRSAPDRLSALLRLQ